MTTKCFWLEVANPGVLIVVDNNNRDRPIEVALLRTWQVTKVVGIHSCDTERQP